MDKLLLRPYVIECELHVPSQSFFFLSQFSLNRHIKQKILQSPGTIIYFQYWEKGGKIKLSEIEIKTIIKMKKHNLCLNWKIVFTSNTDKQTLIDLYEILFIKNLKFFRSFRCLKKVDTCIQSLQTDLVGVLPVAKQKCLGYSRVSLI